LGPFDQQLLVSVLGVQNPETIFVGGIKHFSQRWGGPNGTQKGPKGSAKAAQRGATTPAFAGAFQGASSPGARLARSEEECPQTGPRRRSGTTGRGGRPRPQRRAATLDNYDLGSIRLFLTRAQPAELRVGDPRSEPPGEAPQSQGTELIKVWTFSVASWGRNPPGSPPGSGVRSGAETPPGYGSETPRVWARSSPGSGRGVRG
jgi:hypothetical protein